MHCFGSVQDWPSARRFSQVLALEQKPASEQSSSLVHVVVQVVPMHE
jgi:hypothetical protein